MKTLFFIYLLCPREASQRQSYTSKTPGLYKPRMDRGAKGFYLEKEEGLSRRIWKEKGFLEKKRTQTEMWSWWAKGLVIICICGNQEDCMYSCLLPSFFYGGLKSIFT